MKSDESLAHHALPSNSDGRICWSKRGSLQWFRAWAELIGIVLIASWYFPDSWDLEWLEVRRPTQKSPEAHAVYCDPRLNEPWSKIPPASNLSFYPCFSRHQCARLTVPMDWNSTDPSSTRVDLAITKLPARVPIIDPRYGGLLWLQTGGPGASGIDLLLNRGELIQMVVDSAFDPSNSSYGTESPPKYFDIIAFDSRGVNNTTPRFSCFPNEARRDAWNLQTAAEGVLNSSSEAFADTWARTTAFSEGCSKRLTESEDPEDEVTMHMNTTPVVADIVEVIEKYGQWREQEAHKLLKLDRVSHSTCRKLGNAAVIERTEYRPGEEPVLFWGLSYGTIIGATLAAMQPHRISRAIIDGVADAPDYYRGEWRTNLQDTDSVLDRISFYCFHAGPKACPLYMPGGPSAIIQFIKTTVFSLKGDPIGVPADGDLAPDLITYSDIKDLMRAALYVPLQFFPMLANVLFDVSHRNGTQMAQIKQSSSPITFPSRHCRHAPPYDQKCSAPADLASEVAIAILCSDGDSTYNMTKDGYSEYVETLMEQSWSLGDYWATICMKCVQWSISPSWRFSGPFAGQTAHPMLLVGNLHDPVTPIRNAYAMSHRFSNSSVLAQDGEGHCFLSSPSLCVARHIRRYFQTGALPENGTVCDSNEKPFLGLTKAAEPGDEELLEELRWTAKNFA